MGRAIVHRDLEFAKVDVFDRPQKRSLFLDVYLPDSAPSSPPPLVVWIHGGGWREGSKSRPPIRRLVAAGFALASISHRLSSEAIFPAQIHDCKAAVRWLRAHAEQLGYDGERIGVVGASSGGHLALLLATTGRSGKLDGDIGDFLGISTEVHCVATYFAPTDFVLRARTQPDIVYTEKVGSFALLGGVRLGEVDKRLEIEAGPVQYVDQHSPPLLAYHGTADTLVLPDQSQRIVDCYRRSHRPAELVLLEGREHGGADFFWGPNADRLESFLRCHLEHP